MNPKNISVADYTYSLPAEKIALHGLENRDESKLLLYEDKNISEKKFFELPDLIPSNSLMVFNNTRVIHARLEFVNANGARIEIFLLEPIIPYEEMTSALSCKASCQWKCLVGNLKKWKEKEIMLEVGSWKLEGKKIKVTARLNENIGDTFLIEFSWQPADLTFAEVIDAAGKMPLPPYIKRDVEREDENRYQTVYAKEHGSVAAPTAGLHFTSTILQKLKQKNISLENVVLHVGAGTFKPVKAKTIGEHEMHSEKISVSRKTIEKILEHIQNKSVVTQQSVTTSVIAVGTTSLRTLESLYWFGKKLTSGWLPTNHGNARLGRLVTDHTLDFFIGQWEPYENTNEVSAEESLNAILVWMQKYNLETLSGETQILIAPGYEFKIVDALITNFHQPNSTLLLLVAAFIGNDWKKVYNFALQNDFRFLSYGDSSLLKR